MLLRRFRRRKAVSDPVTVVSRFVDAANRHDADAIAKCLHPDFESIQPIYPSRNFRGSMQVKRNWQAIFESEPGFRLSLVRSASNESTVWVELHGAGRDVEVAGVFIMGVEDELVRWARVYSAVVEQPPVKMATEDPASTVAAEEEASVHEEAEALRRLIDAGRPGDEAAVASAEEAMTLGDEVFAPPADDAVVAADESGPVIAADAEVADEDEDDEDDDDSEYEDEDEYDDDDDDEDDDEDEDDEDEDDEDEDGSAADDLGDDDEDDDEADHQSEVDNGEATQAVPLIEMEAVVADAAAAAEAQAAAAEADLPGPYEDPDSFWQEGELHDLVGSPLSGRQQRGGATGDDDAVVVDINGRRADAGDDPEGDDQSHRSGRRRGGRRRR
ncbi:MAG: hypothetical protein QOG82_1202 [Actinomycetota bacterium]|nr:hypothetical protein [Actinomycetota bacterium]